MRHAAACAADVLGDPRPVGDAADDPPGSVPVQSPPVRGEEDRSLAPLADGQVDGPRGARCQRDGDDLAAPAGDDQGPVPSRPGASISEPVASETRSPLRASRKISASRRVGRARRRPAKRRVRCGPGRWRATDSPARGRRTWAAGEGLRTRSAVSPSRRRSPTRSLARHRAVQLRDRHRTARRRWLPCRVTGQTARGSVEPKEADAMTAQTSGSPPR